MNLPVPSGRRFLQGRHHHIDEARIPICGIPQHRVEHDCDPKDHDVLDPNEQQNRTKEPDHRVHDGQAQKLGRAHEAEKER